MTATALLTGVRVLAPRSDVDRLGDVLIRDGVVARVGAPGESLHWPEHPNNADPTGASADTLVIAPDGPNDELLLTPGLVDIHTHIFGTAGVRRVDQVGTESAVPIIVDAGGSGAATIDDLVSLRSQPARTRVRVLLSIEAGGITDSHPGHNTERSTPQMVTSSIDTFLGAIERHESTIVGLKVWASVAAGVRWVDHAVNLSEMTGLPMMVHVGEINSETERSISGDVIDRMQGGDIATHAFTSRPGALIGANGKILPEVTVARDRGVLFDVAPGTVNLSFDRAEAAMTQGWIPDTISSDANKWAVERNEAMSLPHVMGMFLALGLSLKRTIECSSTNPADALGLETGEPVEGAPATLSVLRRQVAPAIFSDGQRSIRGDESLLPVGSFLDGVWTEAGSPATTEHEIDLFSMESQAFFASLNAELAHMRGHDVRWRGDDLHQIVHRARRECDLSLAGAMRALYAAMSPGDSTLPAGWLLEQIGPEAAIQRLSELQNTKI